MDSYEDMIIPEVPKALPNEQLFIYVPTASNDNLGVAKFDDKHFSVDPDGTVHLQSLGKSGIITIPASEWTDAAPTIASVVVSGVDLGSIILMLPADEETRLTASSAKLSAYPTAFMPVDGNSSITILRAEAEIAPDADMRFAYIVLKTGFSFTTPLAAIIGVDAYGEGGGAASGVDESAVRAIINSMLGNVANVRQYSVDNPPPYPVTSVNGQLGEVNLNASDVGARPSTWMPTAADVGADPVDTAERKTATLRQEINTQLATYDKSTAVTNKISEHNVSTESHQDLRVELQRLADRLNTVLNSDDASLDDFKEIVAYIKSNKDLIDGIATSKVNVIDIVNNLGTNRSDLPLSAAQGVALKFLIDNLDAIVEGKVSVEQLSAAINQALTDAKERGDFDGPRGYAILRVTTSTTSASGTGDTGAAIKYKISLATVCSEAGVDAVYVGDTVLRASVYMYPVVKVDESYVYLGAYTSIKGNPGSNGTNGTSVTVSSVTESTESGGVNLVKFSDGNELTVTNGKDGVSPIVEVTDTPKSVTITIIGADGSRQTGEVSIADLEQNLRAEIAAEWANRGTVTITTIISLDEIDRTDSVEAHSKLYLYEGMLYAYMRSPTPGGEPLFENALDDPNVTKKINTRWSDSGNVETGNNGYYLIRDIPARAEQTVYVNLPRSAFATWYARIQYHDINNAYVSATTTYATQKYKITTDADGVSSFVVGYQNTTNADDSTNTLVANSANIRYIVLALCVSAVISPDGAQGNTLTEDDVADLIVSVGNPIAYSEPDPNRWEWKAAMAWPNIDGLSNKVAALETTSVDHETRIYEVEQAIANGGIVKESLTDSEKLARIKTWNRVVTDKAPVTLIAANRMKPAMTEADRTVAAIYNKYTALAGKYPSLITKTVLGPCSSTVDFPAVDVLRFDVKETDGERNAVRNQYMPKRKIILLAGIHWEWVGIGALYNFVEEVAENPDYGDIRSNAHLIVVPVANPYGATSKVNCPYDAPGHVNANGVAIHNNFGVDHIAGGTVGTYNYGGESPYSELETQYIDSIMAENPDAVAFISCHNCDGDSSYGTGVMWASVASAYTANVAYHVVDKMSDAWYSEYGEDLLTAIDTYKTANLPEGDRCLGRVSLSSSAGTEQKNALKYGIQGLNFEVTHNMPVFSGTTSYTTETMTHATEVYANLVRTILFAFDASDKSDQYKKS